MKSIYFHKLYKNFFMVRVLFIKVTLHEAVRYKTVNFSTTSLSIRNRASNASQTSVALKHTFTNFDHIASLIIAKEELEPMCLLVSCFQGEMMEVYLGFQKIDHITYNPR